MADAAAHYAALASGLDSKVASSKAELARDAGNFVKVKADYQGLADAYRAFYQGLRAIGFPRPAAADAKQLVDASLTLLLQVQAAADAASPGSLASDEANLATAARIQAAYGAAVRRDLGLAAPT